MNPSTRYQPIKRDVRRRGEIPYQRRQLHLTAAGITEPTRHFLEAARLKMTGWLREDTDIHPRDEKKSTLPRYKNRSLISETLSQTENFM
jgi:hypothetical protein